MRKQLDRHGQRVDPKTEESQRDVVLLPTIAKVLRELKLASSCAAPSDFVFASETGTPLQAPNASRRGLVKAVEAAGLIDDTRPIGWHDAEHGTVLETALGDEPPAAATGNGAVTAPLPLIGD